jgi:hypothetical protein
LKRFFNVVVVILGMVGVLSGLWLLHQEYLVGRLFENHAAQISDGRIAEELYQQESLLAWRDLTIHLGLLLASASVVRLGVLQFRRRMPSKENSECGS